MTFELLFHHVTLEYLLNHVNVDRRAYHHVNVDRLAYQHVNVDRLV